MLWGSSTPPIFFNEGGASLISITVGDSEYYDELRNEFIYTKGGTLRFEHSLHAISMWEAKYKKPFLSNSKVNDLSLREQIDYYKFMCLDEAIEDYMLTPDIINQLVDYIQDPQTATVIKDQNGGGRGSIMTSEVIYGIMVSGNIPFECQYWNFNRLLMLIRVVASHHEPKKKMTKSEIFEQNRKLNEERRKQFNTKG